MAIPVPTISQAITNLLTLINAQVATDAQASQVLVVLGQEGADRPNDIVNVATDIRFHLIPEVLMGSFQQGALLEEFEIDVLVSSWSGDPDPATIVARALTLVGYVTTAVRTDPTLGGVELEAYPSTVTGGEAVWTEAPAGRLCEITVTVHCMALN
jgi:hypothetical protein